MQVKDKMKDKIKTGATLIAANTEVTGNVHFDDQLFVNGRVNGDISAEATGKATLVISEEGKVTGEIRVPNVVINGEVEGDVYACAHVELASRGRVKGNVYYKLIEMQLGATVDGQLLHADDVDSSAKVHKLPLPSEESESS